MAGKGWKKTANMEELADQWIGLRETLQDRSIYLMIIMGNSMVFGLVNRAIMVTDMDSTIWMIEVTSISKTLVIYTCFLIAKVTPNWFV